MGWFQGLVALNGHAAGSRPLEGGAGGVGIGGGGGGGVEDGGATTETTIDPLADPLLLSVMVTEIVKSPSVAGASQATWAPVPEMFPPDAFQAYFSGSPPGLSTSTVMRLVSPGPVTTGSATSDVIRCPRSPVGEPEPGFGGPGFPPLLGGVPELEPGDPALELPPLAGAPEPAEAPLAGLPELGLPPPVDAPDPGLVAVAAAPGPGVGTLTELPEPDVVAPDDTFGLVNAPPRFVAAEEPPCV